MVNRVKEADTLERQMDIIEIQTVVSGFIGVEFFYIGFVYGKIRCSVFI